MSMNADKALSIGRYRVKGFLGRGGMAEVFKCELSGLGGFGKVVVVKRILAELAQDPEFIKMFFDEARLSAMLNHPNIAQVYEVDHEDGLPFITMEYVYGPTLWQIMARLGKQKPLPLQYTLRIISDLLEGLHYAHEARGQDGTPLGLVHRDISPHNIMVSMQGKVKVLDFGVAKAEGRLSQTRAGAIKGKFAYMAPEQVGENGIDRRADIFTTGICLYRASTGRLPFSGDSEAKVLTATLSGIYKRPSEIVPDYPAALEDILRIALQLKPENRFQSASDFRDAIEDFAESAGLSCSSSELASYLKSLYPDANETTFDSPDQTALAQYYLKTPTGNVEALQMALTPSQNAVNPVLQGMHLTPPPSNSPWPLRLIAGGVGLLVVVMLALALKMFTASPPAPSPVATASQNPEAELAALMDQAEALSGAGKHGEALASLSQARAIKTSDLELNLRLNRLQGQVETAAFLSLAEQAQKRGDTATAVENAKKVLDRSPDNAAALALLQALAPAPAADQADEAEPETRTSSKNRSRSRHSSSSKRSRSGQLAVRTEPAAMVYVDDTPVGMAPVSGKDLPAGTHVVEVRAKGFETRRREVTIQAGQLASLDVTLTALPQDKDEAPAGAAVAAASAAPAAAPAAVVAAAPRAHAGAGADIATAESLALQDSPRPRAEAPSERAVEQAPEIEPAPAPIERAEPATQPRQRPEIAAPALPGTYRASSAKEVIDAFRRVEDQLVSAGRLKSSVARGVTVPLAKDLLKDYQPGQSIVIYPTAMYYYVVDRAFEGRSRSQIANMLKNSQASGTLSGYASRR